MRTPPVTVFMCIFPNHWNPMPRHVLDGTGRSELTEGVTETKDLKFKGSTMLPLIQWDAILQVLMAGDLKEYLNILLDWN